MKVQSFKRCMEWKNRIPTLGLKSIFNQTYENEHLKMKTLEWKIKHLNDGFP